MAKFPAVKMMVSRKLEIAPVAEQNGSPKIALINGRNANESRGSCCTYCSIPLPPPEYLEDMSSEDVKSSR
ncbi:hypothetical protein GCK72_005235 [Caenorhabditis remanei]|uniref:Uncharacterized protein n=1 Tax=Caenorhabditis remanei TaxID=31234 RepID=A0A6A5HFY6_CAERE|nr:hypothetical protein GCK72_005235 [Caenorhabditis remanei]KAF1765283.1 hypothetical protein GCK72_005235 [Caenorhabditis remanei]